MYYYEARFHDPDIGRFISADSVIDGAFTTQGWNRYMYVHGNPVMHTDPTGMMMINHDGLGVFDEGPEPRDYGLENAQFLTEVGERNLANFNGNNYHSSSGKILPKPPVSLDITNMSNLSAGSNGPAVSSNSSYDAINDSFLNQHKYAGLTPDGYDPVIGGMYRISVAVQLAIAAGIFSGAFSSGYELLAKGSALWGSLKDNFRRFSSWFSALGKGGTAKLNSARELIRTSVDNFHNFPQSFDKTIFNSGTKEVIKNFYNVTKPGYSNTSIMYRLKGSVNGVDGIFEIGTRLSTSGKIELIMHRFFRPLPK